MRLGLFADPHYCNAEILCRTRRPSLSLKKIAETMDAFRQSGVDLCICMGDLVDKSDGDDQLVFLQRALAESSLPCVVRLHENLDAEVRADHQVKNADDVRRILEDSQKVALVIQGHYHKGADHISNRIRYLTLPAMCEGIENRYLILEI